MVVLAREGVAPKIPSARGGDGRRPLTAQRGLRRGDKSGKSRCREKQKPVDCEVLSCRAMRGMACDVCGVGVVRNQ